MNVYKDAGERIYLVRTMRGYTRETLAEMSGISTKFLYEIETGKKGFSGLVLYDLCKALEVGCDFILTGRENAAVYDNKLVNTLELFHEYSMEKIANVLKAIYDLNT